MAAFNSSITGVRQQYSVITSLLGWEASVFRARLCSIRLLFCFPGRSAVQMRVCLSCRAPILLQTRFKAPVSCGLLPQAAYTGGVIPFLSLETRMAQVARKSNWLKRRYHPLSRHSRPRRLYRLFKTAFLWRWELATIRCRCTPHYTFDH